MIVFLVGMLETTIVKGAWSSNLDCDFERYLTEGKDSLDRGAKRRLRPENDNPGERSYKVPSRR